MSALFLCVWQSLWDLGFEKRARWPEPPSAPLSLFHSLFPPLWLFLFVYNSPSPPAHTLFHLSDVRKIKGFAVVTGFCRHNTTHPPYGLYWARSSTSHHQTHARKKMLSAYEHHFCVKKTTLTRGMNVDHAGIYREMWLIKSQPGPHRTWGMCRSNQMTHIFGGRVKNRNGKTILPLFSFILSVRYACILIYVYAHPHLIFQTLDIQYKDQNLEEMWQKSYTSAIFYVDEYYPDLLAELWEIFQINIEYIVSIFYFEMRHLTTTQWHNC